MSTELEVVMSIENIAQAVELRQWEFNNRSRPAVVRYAPGDRGYGPEQCTVADCEGTLPPKRREWGYKICIGCQSETERRARQFAHQ
ncbi:MULTISPECIES: hypothetical protein [Pseudomonas]|uniref:hypothetical protein n=1 Tax=Pseudomonas TaxID=286 RepID=UPI00236053D7|nr:hypothetical protein [Pseudomonas sp. TNT2022 ID642]MDD1003612.1 hypothetical protein [Pseudomonas sp. TNT2022 ID642]